jgi:hypothetical protein
MGFTSNAAIPTATITGTYKDSTGKVWNTYQLSFVTGELTQMFNNETVIQFEKSFPSVEGVVHTYSEELSRVYTIRTLSAAGELRNNILNLLTPDIQDVQLNQDPIITSDVNPNDYKNSNFQKTNIDVLDENWTSVSKHLDLVNAKKAWEYTRGDPSITIGISDVGFHYNNDVDSKVLNLASATANNLMGGGIEHGTGVAGLAAAIGDNSIGIVGVGHKSTLKYYKWIFYNNILQAAKEGCKVINCSWAGEMTPINHNLSAPDYNQKLLEIVYDKYHATVVAAAGNAYTSNCGDNTVLNVGGGYNGTDYHYPASYNGVISVTGVGSNYNLNNNSTNFPLSCPNYYTTFTHPSYQWGNVQSDVKDVH